MTEWHTGNILVVDDTPSNVRFLIDVLSGRGHSVHTATDGMSAIRAARELLPDLVLLDIVMPQLDGFKVCQFLKNITETREIPVIFMTSLSDTRDKIKGFELGAADYVTKPFQAEEVLARVESILSLRAMQRRLEEKNAELQGANRELKLYQEELERLVAERTAELAEANAHLKKEIVERRGAEELARNSLAEKEVLLKEVHHRVKNNLQIITTLLDLQLESISDEKTAHAFRDSQDRIKAMALIHERLYESSDIASIDFGRYIRDISSRLIGSYMMAPGVVDLRVECDEISMGIDRAIPCGLIMNELVSNALKHAFPDSRPGVISIEFHRGEAGRITLKVTDNGVGMPPDMDLTKTGTLGLQLVQMLARQLRGCMAIDGGGKGTSFIIDFPDV